jgi:hypothetical protein
MKNEETENPITLAASLSTERGNFFRRTCPSCGRDFKTEVSPADLQWVVASQVRRMGLEIGVDSNQKERVQSYLYCPYCDHKAASGETMTEETVHRLIRREIVLPMLHKAFGGLDNHRGSGMLSITVKHERSILPQRPIHGPEPPDMRVIEFLCCGEKIKVSEAWTGTNICTFCGTPIILM